MSAKDSSEMSAQIQSFAHAYASITGMHLRSGLAFDRERQLFDVIKAGVTLADFEMVLRHLMWQIKQGKRNLGAVRWSNIVARIDLLDEEIQMAKAERRNAKPAPSPKERVLNQLRPTYGNVDESHCSARHVKELIEELKRAAE